MISGNAELFLGLFIGFILGCIAMVSIVIGAICSDMDSHDNQYDPERMP